MSRSEKRNTITGVSSFIWVHFAGPYLSSFRDGFISWKEEPKEFWILTLRLVSLSPFMAESHSLATARMHSNALLMNG